MRTLIEYKTQPDHVADLLKWAYIVAPGVTFCKNGSFQTTFSYRGPDLDSSTSSELVVTSARLNNLLRRFGDGWTVYVDSTRRRTREYPNSIFPDSISYLIDEERRALFESGEHYESSYFITISWWPPSFMETAVTDMFYDDPERQEDEGFLVKGWKWFKRLFFRFFGKDIHEPTEREKTAVVEALNSFTSERSRFYQQLSSILPSVKALNDEETLEYFHSCVSTKFHPVEKPENAIQLIDHLVTDKPLIGGKQPKLGDSYIGVLTIKNFPSKSFPGILDALNRLGIEYRWVTRFVFMSKAEAESEISKIKRKWFAQRKGMVTMLKEIAFGGNSIMENSDAVNKAQDADAALQELAVDAVTYGWFTQVVVVLDPDLERLKKKTNLIEREINARGYVTSIEIDSNNCLDAWIGSIPGCSAHNIRRQIVNTLNVAHMMPISAVWAGPRECPNDKLPSGSPPLFFAVTNGTTPFRMTNFVNDVGHTFIIGPTGAGKSVLLNTMEAQFLRYPDAQVYIFDKGGSSRIVTAGVAGTFYDLGGEDSTLGFQPLMHVDSEHEQAWAHEWILDILAAENVEITPEIKKAVWNGLSALAIGPLAQRTMTGFQILVQDTTVKDAIAPYTIQGPFGRLLDADHDTLTIGRWIAFEMEELMHTKGAVMPVLSYLFHRLEQRFDGKPTLLVLDEAWLFLDHPAFAAKIREWLKVLRKVNVSVIFATQSLADVDKSVISATVAEACMTKIYLPNDKSRDTDIAAVYKKFGLNDRQLDILAMSRPRRDYYLTSPVGNRLFDLGLGPLAIAYLAATNRELQKHARELLKDGVDDFNHRYLAMRANDPSPERRLDVSWAVDFLRRSVKRAA